MYKLLLILGLLWLQGCAATSRPALGEGVSVKPGWSRLAESTKSALRDPNVWATLLAAAALQIDDLDHEISDQLRQDTPIFGSTEKAMEASDDFRSLTEVAYVSTALIVPGPDMTGEWITTKAKLLGSEWLATKTARGITGNLKDWTQRQRPNRRNDRSFPSGHATTASIQAQMANLNVEYLPLDVGAKQALGLSFDGIAALSAWARVEAGEHYPSDVLAGWAVGHFVGHLARAFIVDDESNMTILPKPAADGIGLELRLRF